MRLAVLLLTLACAGSAHAWTHGYSCPVDGSAAAPSGSAQYPTLLAGYVATPNCKFPTIGYAVGPASGTIFTTVETWTPPTGVTINSTSHLVTISAANVTVNAIDFTGSNGWQMACGSGCVNPTITNNKFAVGSNAQNALTIAVAATGGGTITNNLFDGNDINTGAGNNGIIEWGPTGGTWTIKYNQIRHAEIDCIEAQGLNTALDFEFNSCENVGSAATLGTSHSNFLFFYGTYTSLKIRHNLFLENVSTMKLARGVTCGDNYFQSLCVNTDFSDNLFVLSYVPTGGGAKMSYNMDLNLNQVPPSGATISANYIDPTGVSGSQYNLTSGCASVTGYIDDGAGGGIYDGVSGTVLTVTAVSSGSLAYVTTPAGYYVFGANVVAAQRVNAILTGSGGIGTYRVLTAQAAASATVQVCDGVYGLSPGTAFRSGNINMTSGAVIP